MVIDKFKFKKLKNIDSIKYWDPKVCALFESEDTGEYLSFGTLYSVRTCRRSFFPMVVQVGYFIQAHACWLMIENVNYYE